MFSLLLLLFLTGGRVSLSLLLMLSGTGGRVAFSSAALSGLAGVTLWLPSSSLSAFRSRGWSPTGRVAVLELYCLLASVVGAFELCWDVLVLELPNTLNCSCFRRVIFWYFPVLQFHSFKVTSYFSSSSKFWVGFRDFLLAKFYRKIFSFDSGRGSIAGPAWKSTTDLSSDSITSWKRGRSGRLGTTRSQKRPRPPQVTRKRPRRRFFPLIALRTRVARFFII